MIIDRRTLLGTALAALLHRHSAAPQPGAVPTAVKIGVLNDQSGPYRDLAGMHSVNAAKLAVKEFGDGFNVEVISADHQNKPDVGASIARRMVRPRRHRHHPRRADQLRGARGQRHMQGEEQGLRQHRRRRVQLDGHARVAGGRSLVACPAPCWPGGRC